MEVENAYMKLESGELWLHIKWESGDTYSVNLGTARKRSFKPSLALTNEKIRGSMIKKFNQHL